MTTTDKPQLRAQLRAKRRALRPAQRRRKSALIAHQLSKLPDIQRARTIAGYLAMADEVDLTVLFKLLPHKRWLVPKMIGPGEMVFVEFGTAAGRGLAGIREPVGTRRVTRQVIDVALVPLVGFDRAGRRLGQGGGFYDRYFAPQTATTAKLRTKLIGCAFDCQACDIIPADPWDQALDLIATESKIWRPSPAP